MNYKKKICKTCGKETYIFSHGNCKFCASKQHKVQPKSEDSLSFLMNKADKLFSVYIRKKNADKDGLVKCYICGTPIPWVEAHLMHYVKRDNKKLRYSEQNCHAGCYTCNCSNDGNLVEYREKLVKEFGEFNVKLLENTKSDRLDRYDLITKIEFWKNEIDKL